MENQEPLIAAAVIVVVVLALLAWLFMQRRKTQDLRDRFGVPHVALRLWLPGVSGGLREFEPVGEEVVHLAQNLVSPYCGAYVAEEVLGWFSEAASSLNSFALFALRNGEETFGILAMASEDSERFYPDMGTLYLQRLSDLVSAALLRTVRDEPVLAATE